MDQDLNPFWDLFLYQAPLIAPFWLFKKEPEGILICPQRASNDRYEGATVWFILNLFWNLLEWTSVVRGLFRNQKVKTPLKDKTKPKYKSRSCGDGWRQNVGG